MYMKKVLYLDLDGTLVDFQSGIDRLPIGKREAYRDNYDDTPGIFSLMDPMPGGVEAIPTSCPLRRGTTLQRGLTNCCG